MEETKVNEEPTPVVIYPKPATIHLSFGPQPQEQSPKTDQEDTSQES